MEQNVLDADLHNNPQNQELLPTWIKVFSWLFLVGGGLIPLFILARCVALPYVHVSLLGLAGDLFSGEGLVATFFFVLKGIVGFGLLWHKPWAVNLGIIDAVLSFLASCAAFYFVIIANTSLKLPLEIIPIAFYLYWLVNNRTQWADAYSNN